MSRWGALLDHWRWPLALLAAAACTGVGWQARRLGVDPSNTAFFIREDASYQIYQAFRDRFGSDDTIVIGLRMPDGLTPAAAETIQSLSRDLSGLPHVEEVQSLTSVVTLERAWFGRLVERPLMDGALDDRHPTDTLLERVRTGPPEARHLLSNDGRMTAIVLRVAGTDQDRHYRHTLIERARSLLRAHDLPDDAYLLTGTAVEQDAFLDRIGQDRRIFVPATVGVIAALLLLLHAEWRALAFAGAVMGVSLAATQGLMVITDTPINPVTTLLAPIILIVAVSSTVHLSGSFAHAAQPRSRGAQLAAVYGAMFLPCLLANLTTAIGFLSLLVSRVAAVREFGRFGAIGTAIAWGLTMLWTPLFLSFGHERPSPLAPWFASIGRALAWWTTRYRWSILIVSLACVATAAVVAPAVRASTDLLATLRPADPFRTDTEALQQALGGIYPLEIVLEAPTAEAPREPETWQRLDQWEEAVEQQPMVSYAVGLVDVLRYLSKVTRQERTRAWTERVLTTLPEHLGAPLRTLAADDYRLQRVTAYLHSSDTARVLALADELRRLATTWLPTGWTTQITGQTMLLATMSQELVRDEVGSVGLAFGVILLVVWLAMRSLTYALISILPNLLPIAGLFGLMAAWRIPLNTATAMIASVAIGLIFDNTIHLIARYRDGRAAGLDARGAIAAGLTRCAHPMIASSLILVGGFAVTMLGRMTPTADFGRLTCATIGLALAGDVILLPAILAIVQPR